MLQEELSFTEDECAELDRAKTMPIIFDKDCPETTSERALRFRRANPIQRLGREETIAIGNPLMLSLDFPPL